MNNRLRNQKGNTIIVVVIGVIGVLILIGFLKSCVFGGPGGPGGPGSPPSGPDSRHAPRPDQVIVDLSESPPKVMPAHFGLPQPLTRDSVRQWISSLPTDVKEIRLIVGGKTTRSDIIYFEEGERESGIRVIR